MDTSDGHLSGADMSMASASREIATTDLAPTGTVTLNVGGKLFTTFYETLQRDPKSLLAQSILEGGPRDAQARPSTCCLYSHHAIIARKQSVGT